MQGAERGRRLSRAAECSTRNSITVALEDYLNKPLTANHPLLPILPCFPLPSSLCSPPFSALEDGLSGAPKRGNPGVTEEGERYSEEEAGGGAKQAERRGV